MYITFAPVHSKSHIKALKNLLSQCQLRRSYRRVPDERHGKRTGSLGKEKTRTSYFCLQCDLRFLDFYFFPGSMPSLPQSKICEKCAAVNARVVYSKYSQLRSKKRQWLRFFS